MPNLTGLVNSLLTVMWMGRKLGIRDARAQRVLDEGVSQKHDYKNRIKG